MSGDSVQEWLVAGITAVKNGHLTEARDLLEAVLEADERNEVAWLWLSGAVETVEEQQLCLENVLEINPQHTVALEGLAKLKQRAEQDVRDEQGKTQTITREYAPLSTAAALLYPESQTKTWEWRDPTAVPNKASTVGYQSDESYYDVWSRNVPLCCVCACELAPEDEQCPQCKKRLLVRMFRHPRASTNITALWVLLLGTGQLLLLQSIYNILVQDNLYAAVGNSIMMVVYVVLAIGVYYRQSWAHLISIYLLSATILFLLLRWAIPIDLERLGLANLDPAIQNFVLPLTSGLGETVRLFILVATGLALFYAVIKTAPDFDRVAVRRVAKLTKGPTNAADFNNAAKKLARDGLWATAVLHWQRAAALAPNHFAYQESLGHAYARLGFYKRSLDILQYSYKHSSSPERQAKIQTLIDDVQAKMTQNS